MEATAIRSPEFTSDEWALLYELLDRQRALLPVEIHHCATRRMKEELKARLQLVEKLQEKIEPLAPQGSRE